jgi:nucleoside-diphosphate-sugar epimerase
MSQPNDYHVVVGAGQIGPTLARLLTARNARVRLVRRASASPVDGIDVVQADLGDRASLAAATANASVIYHCANPRYLATEWAALLPVWTENLIAAAGRAKARLVVLDNVYAFGDLNGQPLDERAPYNPCSKKGEVRARVARRLDEAHAHGDARVVVGRASDFWGPRGTLTYFGDQFWPRAFKGKPVQTLGNVSTPHTYHYIPDVAAGLATLGSAPESVAGQWWMLPCQPPASFTEMAARLGRASDLVIRSTPVPGFMLPVLGLFIRELPDLREMLYQWDQPFVMNDGKYRAAFPDVQLTGTDDAAAATVAWARRHYGATP